MNKALQKGWKNVRMGMQGNETCVILTMFWSRTNMPKTIENEDYLIQKINYIHENPVHRQYVKKPEYWMWSSVNPNNDIVIESMVL